MDQTNVSKLIRFLNPLALSPPHSSPRFIPITIIQDFTPSQSTIHNPQSTIHNPQSTDWTSTVYSVPSVIKTEVASQAQNNNTPYFTVNLKGSPPMERRTIF